MQCENNFCIYCDKSKCILDSISLDSLSMCTECIQIELDENILKIEKKKLREKFYKSDIIL